MKTAKNVLERVETYRYYANPGDLTNVSILVLSYRLNAFAKTHKIETDNRIRLAGGKP